MDGSNVRELPLAATLLCGTRPSLTITDIKNPAAEYFGITITDLVSDSDDKPLIFYRAAAIYYARKLTTATLAQIGKAFGDLGPGKVNAIIQKTDDILDRRLHLGHKAVARYDAALLLGDFLAAKYGAAVTDILHPKTSDRLTVRDIQAAAVEHFGVTHDRLLSEKRGAELVLARHAAMYYARAITRRSYPDLAYNFKRNDHTTIMNAIEKIGTLLARDPACSEIAKPSKRVKHVVRREKVIAFGLRLATLVSGS